MLDLQNARGGFIFKMEESEGVLGITFPEVPEVITQVNVSDSDVVKDEWIRDAVYTAFDFYKEDKRPINFRVWPYFDKDQTIAFEGNSGVLLLPIEVTGTLIAHNVMCEGLIEDPQISFDLHNPSSIEDITAMLKFHVNEE